MPTLAFLTLDDPSPFVIYDDLAKPPLKALGYEVQDVPWRADPDWDRFDGVILRSPWDYQDDPSAFLQVLETIEASRARLANPLDVVRWNLKKTYLRELSRAGVPVVPTAWDEDLAPSDVERALKLFRTDEVVVKPQVGANADDTFRLRKGHLWDEAEAALAGRPFLIQPFVRAVVEEGEYSLFYFGGALSHAILKTPKVGDFRVQEEHGGRIRAVPLEGRRLDRWREHLKRYRLLDVTPKDIETLVRTGEKACAACPGPLLYARVDLVRWKSGFVVMEVELIEPSLYFPYDADSPYRFAHAAHVWLGGEGVAPHPRERRM